MRIRRRCRRLTTARTASEVVRTPPRLHISPDSSCSPPSSHCPSLPFSRFPPLFAFLPPCSRFYPLSHIPPPLLAFLPPYSRFHPPTCVLPTPTRVFTPFPYVSPPFPCVYAPSSHPLVFPPLFSCFPPFPSLFYCFYSPCHGIDKLRAA